MIAISNANSSITSGDPREFYLPFSSALAHIFYLLAQGSYAKWRAPHTSDEQGNAGL